MFLTPIVIMFGGSLEYPAIMKISTPLRIICLRIIIVCYSSYIIICVLTYTFIFITIIKSRRNSQEHGGNDEPATTMFQFIRDYIKTNGYTTPFLITLTYLVFVVIPLITAYNGKINSRLLHIIVQIYTLTYPLNNISDAVIYVILDRDIQKFSRKKFCRGDTQENSQNNNDTTAQYVVSTV